MGPIAPFLQASIGALQHPHLPQAPDAIQARATGGLRAAHIPPPIPFVPGVDPVPLTVDNLGDRLRAYIPSADDQSVQHGNTRVTFLDIAKRVIYQYRPLVAFVLPSFITDSSILARHPRGSRPIRHVISFHNAILAEFIRFHAFGHLYQHDRLSTIADRQTGLYNGLIRPLVNFLYDNLNDHNYLDTNSILTSSWKNFSSNACSRLARGGIWSTEYLRAHAPDMGVHEFDFRICSGIWYPIFLELLKHIERFNKLYRNSPHHVLPDQLTFGVIAPILGQATYSSTSVTPYRHL